MKPAGVLVVALVAGSTVIGQEVPPRTLERLQSEDWRERWLAVSALGGLASESPAALKELTAALSDSDIEVAIEAARSIGRAGAAARAALPRLLGVLGSSDRPRLRTAARDALIRLSGLLRGAVASQLVQALAKGPPEDSRAWGALEKLPPEQLGKLVPRLAKLLEAEESSVRWYAAMLLWRVGPDARDAVTALAERVRNDPDSTVRREAAYALGEIGEVTKPVLQALEHGSQDEDKYVRQSSLEALATLGRPAAPLLLKALRKADPETVNRALHHRSWRRPEPLAPVVLELLKSEQPWLRKIAASMVGTLGSAAQPAIPVLMDRLNAPSPKTRLAAAASLLQLKPQHEQAIEVFHSSAARAAAPFVRNLAVRALYYLAEQDPMSTVPVIVRMLRSKNAGAREAALWILAQKDVGATDAVPLLARLLSDPAAGNRSSAARALGRMGVAARPALPAVVRASGDADVKVRFRAVRALGAIHPEAAEARGALGKRLDDPNPAVRRAALRALAGAGQTARDHVRRLRKDMREKKALERVLAAAAVHAIDPSSTAAVIAVLTAELDSSVAVRLGAIRVLRAMGPAARTAARSLLDHLKDGDADVVKATRTALHRVLE